MNRSVIVLAALVVLTSCGDCGGGHNADNTNNGGSGTGVLEVLAEGTGDPNTGSLWPMHAGTVIPYRRGAIRSPIEFAPGRVGYRYLSQAGVSPQQGPLDAKTEVWFSVDDKGTWFEGATNGGLLDSPILLVPATVRVGLRWRTGGEKSSREYEVTARDEVETRLGPSVLWTIRQDTEPPIYRLYAEGWGLISADEEEPRPQDGTPSTSMRAVVPDAPEPTQSTGPTLTLREVTDQIEEPPNRCDSVRAIRLGDGRTLLNSMGLSTGPTGSRVVAQDLLYDGGELSGGRYLGAGDRFPPGVDATRVSPWETDSIVVYELGPESIFGIGNVVHFDGRIAWSVQDLLMWQNELGGISGLMTNGTPVEGGYRYELTNIAPGYGETAGRPHWGGMHGGAGRILLSGEANPELVPFGRVAGFLGELWTANSERYAFARRMSPPKFVEAFPDALPNPILSHRAPAISTTSGPDEQVHLFTYPGGVVDRIVVDADGAHRQRLGRADLPEGHELRAAADPGDGKLVLFTFDFEHQISHVWIAEGAQASPVDPAPFIAMNWSGWDVRVCWPATSKALDASDWRLGPAPIAAAIPDGDNCAMVIRDLEATPLPSGASSFDPPDGWSVFEGTVPGVGHVRAFEPSEAGYSLTVPAGGAWLEGGGAISTVSGLEESSRIRFSDGGVPLGREPYVSFFMGAADQSGAGVWVHTNILEFPDEHCGMGCLPDSTPVIALAGPNPQVFELQALLQPAMSPIFGGGVLMWNTPSTLVVSAHNGPVHLRTDGTIVEITLPDQLENEAVFLVRASGEVCGSGQDVSPMATSDMVWCAQPDGTAVRTGRVPDGATAIGMFLLDDDTALAAGTGGEIWVVDMSTLIAHAYPDSGVVSRSGVGADGVTYGTLQDGGATSWGAFQPDRFVPLSEIYDVSALAMDDQDISSLLVTEDVVYVGYGAHTLRVPRTRWAVPTGQPGGDCNGGPTATCWADADGDGFAPADAVPMSACSCPDRMTDVQPTGGDVDCADDDDRAFPGQTMFFADQIPGLPAGQSFDYDCDGTEEGRWGIASCQNAGSMMCTSVEGFAGNAPCGAASPYQGCPDPNDPTRCGGSCAFDIGLQFCGFTQSTLFWTQECH